MARLKVKWNTILGRNPRNQDSDARKSVIVSLSLPHMGQHGMQWKVAEALGLAYHHYAFRLHDKAQPVNVQVYGDRKVVEGLTRSGQPVVCELELVVKTVEGGREFILVNLYLTAPYHRRTHAFEICGAPADRPWFVYTTKDMNGVGIAVKPFV